MNCETASSAAAGVDMLWFILPAWSAKIRQAGDLAGKKIGVGGCVRFTSPHQDQQPWTDLSRNDAIHLNPGLGHSLNDGAHA